MIEFALASQQPDAPRPAVPVTVIGLGGAGTNILDTIALEGLPGTQLIALNTDARALQSSMLGVKLQLGEALTRGLGAGGDPELGAEAVRASEADIREELQGQKMVFLCTGLGGGTGSGAAPLVARLARGAGAFVVVFAVMPFAFEGKRRLRQAEEALSALRAEADALITFDNDRLGEVVLPKKGIHEAFAAADKIVSQSIRAIINLVSAPGLIRIGMDELIAAVGRGDTRCLFGYGSGRGTNRVSEALAGALKSPLLHKGQLRERGRSVLVHVCGGPQMTFAEVQDLMRELNDGHLHEEACILFGTGVDPAMGDQLSLTLLTSLSPEEVHPEAAAPEPAAKSGIHPPGAPSHPPATRLSHSSAAPASAAPASGPPAAASITGPAVSSPGAPATTGATGATGAPSTSAVTTTTPATSATRPAAIADHPPVASKAAPSSEAGAEMEPHTSPAPSSASHPAPPSPAHSAEVFPVDDELAGPELAEEDTEAASPCPEDDPPADLADPAGHADPVPDEDPVALGEGSTAVESPGMPVVGGSMSNEEATAEAGESGEATVSPSVEDWAPSHVRQGITARMAAEAQARAASSPPAATRPFHLRDLARERSAAAASAGPDRPSPAPAPRTHPFKSWQREEERRDPNAPIEYENVGSVSEFEPPSPPPTPAPDLSGTLTRAPKPISRLGFLAFGRGSRDNQNAPVAESARTRAEQETFDRTLRPLSSNRGRFDKAEPTIEDGEDLDVPTFMRRKH